MTRYQPATKPSQQTRPSAPAEEIVGQVQAAQQIKGDADYPSQPRTYLLITTVLQPAPPPRGPSSRHGGVYALKQLSELDARYRGHAPRPSHRVRPPAGTIAAVNPESEVRAARTPVHGGVADAVGAALAVLSRRR